MRWITGPSLTERHSELGLSRVSILMNRPLRLFRYVQENSLVGYYDMDDGLPKVDMLELVHFQTEKQEKKSEAREIEWERTMLVF